MDKEKATLYADRGSNFCKSLQGLIESRGIELTIIDSGSDSRPVVHYKGSSLLGVEEIRSCFGDNTYNPLFGYD